MKYIRKFNKESEYSKARKDEYVTPWVSLTKNCEDKCNIVSITVSGAASGDVWELKEEDFTNHDYDGEYYFVENVGCNLLSFSGNSVDSCEYDYYYGGRMDLNSSRLGQKTVSISRSEEYVLGLVIEIEYGDSFQNRVNYVKDKEEKLLDKPLTFEITDDGYISYSHHYGASVTLKYSKNGGEWQEITPTQIQYDEPGTLIQVVSGDTVAFIGNNGSMCSDYWTPGSSFRNSTCGFKLSGNILSLLYENFWEKSCYEGSNWAFPNLFEGCTGLTDASELILSHFIGDGMYYSMFYGCTNLTAAPVIPPVINPDYDYSYNSTFRNMFEGCSRLNYLKFLFNGAILTYGTGGAEIDMFLYNVAPNGTIVLPGCGLNLYRGDRCIPLSWTILDESGNDITSCYPIGQN